MNIFWNVMICSILLVILCIGFYQTIGNHNRATHSRTRMSPRMKSSVHTLIRQSARWAFASLQDKSPMVTLLHANYAAGYLWGLLEIASIDEIQSVVSINVPQFINIIKTLQETATKRVTHRCPQFLGSHSQLSQFLARIAGTLN